MREVVEEEKQLPIQGKDCLHDYGIGVGVDVLVGVGVDVAPEGVGVDAAPVGVGVEGLGVGFLVGVGAFVACGAWVGVSVVAGATVGVTKMILIALSSGTGETVFFPEITTPIMTTIKIPNPTMMVRAARVLRRSSMRSVYHTERVG